MSMAYAEWHHRAKGLAGARRMLQRGLFRTKHYFVERWKAFAEYSVEVKRLDAEERKRVENERIVKNCLMKMKMRQLAAAHLSWKHFAQSRIGYVYYLFIWFIR
jgi:hypothetical protein